MLRRADRGRDAHVERVVADNAEHLLRYFRRRVERPDDAADLLGRALLALWEGAARVPLDEADARMWCYGIARNVLREHRRHGVRQLAIANDLREQLRVAPLGSAGADVEAEAAIRANLVRAALGQLSEPARELVTLVHWDGCSIAEAARVLRINESTARTRYGRALRRLQALLHDPPGAAGGVTGAVAAARAG